jgi:hypothetical protein
MFFLKLMFYIIAFFISLGVGAELEKQFPGKPVTEIWGLTIIGLLAFFGIRWAFNADRKRATTMLQETGLYDEATLSAMSTVELTTREKRHQKDGETDWSGLSFNQLLDMEKADNAAKAAARAEKSQGGGWFDTSKGFHGTYGKRIICMNCGTRMSKHFGMWSKSPVCRDNGVDCVPYEAPNV